MKILFDHQIFSFQNFGGASRYFTELMNGMNQIKNVDYDIALSYSNNDYLPRVKGIVYKNLFKKAKILFKNYLLFSLNTALNSKKVYKRDYDVFHPTYYHPYFLKLIGDKPYVITVFDMIHELYKDDYPELNSITLKYKRETITRANAVIAISENTKKDIVNIYGVDPGKIHVIHLAGATLPKPPAKIDIKLPSKYLLYVGTRRMYKNFDFFVDAVSDILKKSEYYLVCGGGGDFSIEEKKMFKHLKITDRVVWVDISDNKVLAHLYKNAYAHVIPSLYEGFGVTILEAFSMGCPVILSNAGSLPEIAGDAGIYFDPKSKISINTQISNAFNDDKFISIGKVGYRRRGKFSWKKTLESTIKVYTNKLTQ